jgi:HEAT repeat protein
LGEIKDPRAVDPLITVLKKDLNADVRQAAASALGNIKDLRAVNPLIAALKDANASVRQQAAWALGKIKDARAAGPLITALGDADSYLRQLAALALGDIKDPLAVEPLIAALNDADHGVRDHAASSLGKIRDPRAVVPLIAAFKDTNGNTGVDVGVRESAAAALVTIGTPAVEPLIAAHNDPRSGASVRSLAVSCLGKIKDPRAIEPLIADLTDAGPDLGFRAGAASALEMIGAPAVDRLIAALKDADTDVRDLAASALGNIKDPRAIEPLIRALKGRHGIYDFFPGSAASALVNIGTPAVEPLIAALRDADRDVRKLAVFALGNIGDPRAVEPIIAALKDGNTDFQNTAASALAEIGAPAVEPLIALLKDTDVNVRLSAASALGMIKDQRSFEALLAGLRESDLAMIAGAYPFFIQRGEQGSVGVLISALNAFGNEGMAKDYLNSGQPDLKEAASTWARAHHFFIQTFVEKVIPGTPDHLR